MLKGKDKSKYTGDAAHHIVARNDKRAEDARKILKKNGIDIDSVDNGVFLPKDVHARVHTKLYHETVVQRLKDTADVKGELQKIGNELLEGTFFFSP